jgi:Ulp1 family protease
VFPQLRRLEYYDSMAAGGLTRDGERMLRYVLRWLRLDAEARGEGTAVMDAEWTLDEPRCVPRQRDRGSCGVFALCYAERLVAAARPPLSGFAQPDMPRIRLGLAHFLLGHLNTLP